MCGCRRRAGMLQRPRCASWLTMATGAASAASRTACGTHAPAGRPAPAAIGSVAAANTGRSAGEHPCHVDRLSSSLSHVAFVIFAFARRWLSQVPCMCQRESKRVEQIAGRSRGIMYMQNKLCGRCCRCVWRFTCADSRTRPLTCHQGRRLHRQSPGPPATQS